MEGATSAPREKNEKKKHGKKAKRILKRILIILLILAVLAGAAWYLIHSLKAQYTVTYQGYTASLGTISNALSFSGTLQAVHSASYTANGNGTVRNVYVKAGDHVTKGDKLIRLSTGQTAEAEFDGTVNVMDLAEGDTVSAGSTLCQIVDFTHMKTSIRVDEYDINSVKVGDSIRITTTATEKTFNSAIAAINYTSSSGGSVAYYTATAYVDVSEGVYPGMQVTVTLPQEEATDVVVLKMDAISFDETNAAFVYMEDENGEMRRNYITTGVSNGSYAEIRSGLSDGDTVYVQVKSEAANPVTGLLSSIFGRVNSIPSSGSGRTMFSMGTDLPEGFSFDRGSRNGMGGMGGMSGGFGGGDR